jgi:hypothetical protein
MHLGTAFHAALEFLGMHEQLKLERSGDMLANPLVYGRALQRGRRAEEEAISRIQTAAVQGNLPKTESAAPRQAVQLRRGGICNLLETRRNPPWSNGDPRWEERCECSSLVPLRVPACQQACLRT